MNPQYVHDLSPAAIRSGTWTVVSDACTAKFAVRDKLVATTHGALPIHSGTVVTDEGGNVVRARMELDVSGVTTGNAHRDRDLQKPQFLDAANHPTIVVEASPTSPSTSGWTIQARLSARGASTPVELHVNPTMVSDRQVRVRVTGQLDRTGLGMRVPAFIIGRHLEIDVDALFERVDSGSRDRTGYGPVHS
jgi:polyisoprenoid-binding protein YceI